MTRSPCPPTVHRGFSPIFNKDAPLPPAKHTVWHLTLSCTCQNGSGRPQEPQRAVAGKDSLLTPPWVARCRDPWLWEWTLSRPPCCQDSTSSRKPTLWPDGCHTLGTYYVPGTVISCHTLSKGTDEWKERWQKPGFEPKAV